MAVTCPPSRFLAWLPLLLLGGCVTQPPAPIVEYTPPDATGPYVARLLVRGSLQTSERFAIFNYEGAQECTGPQRIASGSGASRAPATLLRAERLTTVSTWLQFEDKQTCRFAHSFVPRSGRTYLLAASTKDRRCRVYIFDATDPDKLEPEPSIRRRNINNQACVPLGGSLAPANPESDADDPGKTPSTPAPAANGGQP